MALPGLGALASCGYTDYWIGDAAATMPDESAWVTLPMRAFVTRPGLMVEGMQLCTKAKCGYDAAIERFSASGADAAALERSLGNPRALQAQLDRPEPATHKPAPKVAVESFGAGKWSGLHVDISGGTASHAISAYAVGQRTQVGTTFIVVVAGNDDIAQRLIAAATQ